MKETKITSKLTIAGGVLAVAMLSTVASAQTTDGEWITGDAYVEEETKGKAKTKAKGSATPEMICEAEERRKARTAKFLADGTPEEFGSEEPFTFDPSVC